MLPNGVVITQSEHVETAVFVDMQRILCNLPDRDPNAAMLAYSISVANDAGQYSDTKRFAFYDSRCMTCDGDQVCTPKVGESRCRTCNMEETKVNHNRCLSSPPIDRNRIPSLIIACELCEMALYVVHTSEQRVLHRAVLLHGRSAQHHR